MSIVTRNQNKKMVTAHTASEMYDIPYSTLKDDISRYGKFDAFIESGEVYKNGRVWLLSTDAVEKVYEKKIAVKEEKIQMEKSKQILETIPYMSLQEQIQMFSYDYTPATTKQCIVPSLVQKFVEQPTFDLYELFMQKKSRAEQDIQEKIQYQSLLLDNLLKLASQSVENQNAVTTKTYKNSFNKLLKVFFTYWESKCLEPSTTDATRNVLYSLIERFETYFKGFYDDSSHVIMTAIKDKVKSTLFLETTMNDLTVEEKLSLSIPLYKMSKEAFLRVYNTANNYNDADLQKIINYGYSKYKLGIHYKAGNFKVTEFNLFLCSLINDGLDKKGKLNIEGLKKIRAIKSASLITYDEHGEMNGTRPFFPLKATDIESAYWEFKELLKGAFVGDKIQLDALLIFFSQQLFEKLRVLEDAKGVSLLSDTLEKELDELYKSTFEYVGLNFDLDLQAYTFEQLMELVETNHQDYKKEAVSIFVTESVYKSIELHQDGGYTCELYTSSFDKNNTLESAKRKLISMVVLKYLENRYIENALVVEDFFKTNESPIPYFSSNNIRYYDLKDASILNEWLKYRFFNRLLTDSEWVVIEPLGNQMSALYLFKGNALTESDKAYLTTHCLRFVGRSKPTFAWAEHLEQADKAYLNAVRTQPTEAVLELKPTLNIAIKISAILSHSLSYADRLKLLATYDNQRYEHLTVLFTPYKNFSELLDALRFDDKEKHAGDILAYESNRVSQVFKVN